LPESLLNPSSKQDCLVRTCRVLTHWGRYKCTWISKNLLVLPFNFFCQMAARGCYQPCSSIAFTGLALSLEQHCL
jgi:hypothetical protein